MKKIFNFIAISCLTIFVITNILDDDIKKDYNPKERVISNILFINYDIIKTKKLNMDYYDEIKKYALFFNRQSTYNKLMIDGEINPIEFQTLFIDEIFPQTDYIEFL